MGWNLVTEIMTGESILFRVQHQWTPTSKKSTQIKLFSAPNLDQNDNPKISQISALARTIQEYSTSHARATTWIWINLFIQLLQVYRAQRTSKNDRPKPRLKQIARNSEAIQLALELVHIQQGLTKAGKHPKALVTVLCGYKIYLYLQSIPKPIAHQCPGTFSPNNLALNIPEHIRIITHNTKKWYHWNHWYPWSFRYQRSPGPPGSRPQESKVETAALKGPQGSLRCHMSPSGLEVEGGWMMWSGWMLA